MEPTGDKITKKNVTTVVTAQATAISEISKRLVYIESSTVKQEGRNQNVIIGVLIAVVLIVAAVAVQVSVSDKRDRERTDQLLEKVYENQLKTAEVNTSLELLRARNQYLK